MKPFIPYEKLIIARQETAGNNPEPVSFFNQDASNMLGTHTTDPKGVNVWANAYGSDTQQLLDNLLAFVNPRKPLNPRAENIPSNSRFDKYWENYFKTGSK